jgi:hypothetical protein
VRKMASSIAESPPPTTAIGFSRKKNPSHVAQVETPWPRRRCSDGSPSIRAVAPVVTIIALPRYSVLATQTPNGDADRSTRSASAVTNSAPKRSACSRNFIISSGPRMPSGKPGKFSTSVVSMSWPPAPMPSTTIGRRLARPA